VVDTVPRVDLQEVPTLVDGDPRRAMQLVELLAASQALDDELVHASTIDDVLDGVLASCIRTLQVDNAFFLERASGHSSAFRVRASQSSADGPTVPGGTDTGQQALPLSTEILRLLLERQKGLRVAIDAGGGEGAAPSPSVLAAPIFGPEGVHAALVLDNRDRGQAFSRRDLLVLMGIGDQTSRLLSRAKRLRKAHRRGEIEGRFTGVLPPELVEAVVQGRPIEDPEPREAAVVALAVRPRGWDLVVAQLGTVGTLSLLHEIEGTLVGRVMEHGGVVERCVDGTLVAVWGALEPRADDVLLALKAAVALRDDLRTLQTARDGAEMTLPTPAFSIGVNQGVATVGWTGQGQRPSLRVLGEPVDLAIRMAEVADPGEIVVRRDLAAAVEGTEIDPLPSVEGPDSPLLLCRLLSLSPAGPKHGRYDVHIA
jgi:class 3 adenylate cyclase